MVFSINYNIFTNSSPTTSPAFGDLSEISHFYSFTLGSDDDRRAMLGHSPLKEQDVYEVFARYVGKCPNVHFKGSNEYELTSSNLLLLL
jgi:hypothetical protein